MVLAGAVGPGTVPQSTAHAATHGTDGWCVHRCVALLLSAPAEYRGYPTGTLRYLPNAGACPSFPRPPGTAARSRAWLSPRSSRKSAVTYACAYARAQAHAHARTHVYAKTLTRVRARRRRRALSKHARTLADAARLKSTRSVTSAAMSCAVQLAQCERCFFGASAETCSGSGKPNRCGEYPSPVWISIFWWTSHCTKRDQTPYACYTIVR